jgi:hypothetical protein
MGAARVAEILERMHAACARAGRSSADVVLIGASKGQPIERMLTAYDAGLWRLGENRVQEAEEKRPLLPADVEWHLLGPLQSNKVRRAIALFDVVHSVDRLKILHSLEREAASARKRLRIFLEVNLGGEQTKHGFAPAVVVAAAEEAVAGTALELAGLMAIPPAGDAAEDSRPWFQQLRRLRDEVASRLGDRFGAQLSMGMSDDFEVAIEEGATHVRVGTALFGSRDSSEPG